MSKNVLVVREDKETVDKIARGLELKRKIFEILEMLENSY